MIEIQKKKEVIEMYLNGIPRKEISKKYGYKTESTVSGIIKDYKKSKGLNTLDQISNSGIVRKGKYDFDQTYFKKIDSVDKAYFFGLLCADGSIGKTKKEIKISLQEDDKNILELFNKSLKTDKPLRCIKNNSIYNRKTQWSLCIEKVKVWKNLLELGMNPNKTEKFEIPLKNIPENLLHHFLRGFFDGDGSITNTKSRTYKYAAFSFSGTKELIEQIREILNKNIGISINKTISKRYKNKNTNSGYSILFGGNGISKKFYDYIYKDCGEFYLKRKKLKFEKLLTAPHNGNIMVESL